MVKHTQKPTNYFSVFYHFLGLALKGLILPIVPNYISLRSNMFWTTVVWSWEAVFSHRNVFSVIYRNVKFFGLVGMELVSVFPFLLYGNILQT